jgi:hypothetical protein
MQLCQSSHLRPIHRQFGRFVPCYANAPWTRFFFEAPNPDASLGLYSATQTADLTMGDQSIQSIGSRSCSRNLRKPGNYPQSMICMIRDAENRTEALRAEAGLLDPSFYTLIRSMKLKQWYSTTKTPLYFSFGIENLT